MGRLGVRKNNVSVEGFRVCMRATTHPKFPLDLLPSCRIRGLPVSQTSAKPRKTKCNDCVANKHFAGEDPTYKKVVAQ